MVSVGGSSWMPVAVPLGAPDAIVQAGGARFAAHARLLAAHSGYFKSVLGARRTQEDGDDILYVPNVSAQQFWPLLAYMYTGYLDLSPDNIYQVLLATHLLHMPRALDLCRTFLAQGRIAPLPPTIIKPIPSRKLPPFLTTNVFRPLYTDNSLIFRSSLEETSFRIPDAAVQEDDKTSTPVQNSPPLNDTQKDDKNTDSYDSSPNYINVVDGPEASTVNLTKSNEVKRIKTPKNVSELDAEHEEIDKFKNKTEEIKINCAQSDEKVIIDIACCDGPVRFHRVLNRAYKNNPMEKSKDVSELTDSEDSYVEIEEDTRSKDGSVSFDNCNAFSRSLQKQMNENIKTMHGKHNENCFNGETSQSSRDLPSSNQQTETIYTCVYCNHTFKSQYCYQKHARRHLNPVSIDAVNQDGIDNCYKAHPLIPKTASSTPGPKREVRLLDMNVQYYPCKTCGSKFPSYYFVHKHRKMCHAEELEASDTIKGNTSTDKKRKISSIQKESKPNTEPCDLQGSSNIDKNN